MQIQSKVVAAALLGAVCLHASASAAAILTFSFSGEISSGVDSAGAFGLAGADMSGAAYSAILRFDTAQATFIGQYGSVGAAGGPAFPPFGPSFGSGEFTTGGATTQIEGQSFSVLSLGGDRLLAYALDMIGSSVNNWLVLQFYDSPSFSDSLATPFSGNPCGHCEGSYLQVLGTTKVFLGIDQLDYTVVGDLVLPDPGRPIPEPGVWALLLVGFGAVGHALRRRQALACLAA